eukprot:Rhum_TRINITY_DN15152_c0_g2::Rhum_TRINITY_DN15152_c0_g2_i4::g.140667::m.140667
MRSESSSRCLRPLLFRLSLVATLWLLFTSWGLEGTRPPRILAEEQRAVLFSALTPPTPPPAQQPLPHLPPPTPLLASLHPLPTPKPTARHSPRTAAPVEASLIPNVTLLPDVCYHIATGSCNDAKVSDGGEGRLTVGAGPVLAFRLNLQSYDAASATLTVTVVSCEPEGVAPRNLRVTDRFGLALDSGEPSVFTLRSKHFTGGKFRWEDHEGRVVTLENNALKTEDTEAQKIRPTRKGVTWVLAKVGEQAKKRNLREGRRLFFLKGGTVGSPLRYPEKVWNSPDGRICDRSRHGCCWPRPVQSFVQPTTADRDRFPREKSDVARLTVVIVSSRFTFERRSKLLERWVFDTSLVSQLVISLDCECEALDEWLDWGPEKAKVDWLVGPTGAPPHRYTEVAVRVLMMMHWTFARHEEDWTMMVDDDSLVYGRSLAWVLAALPDPKTTPLYVGHTSEWYAKTLYHGDMAFGGGGTLVSRAAAKQWLQRWGTHDGTADRSPVDAMLRSGECSHSGGDGAVCRCVVASVGREKEVFVDWKGFHQFDVVGTKALPEMLRPSCPNCPRVETMTGLFLLDTIGAQPVVTLHHLFATGPGHVYPGLSPGQAMDRMSQAYEVHPDLLPLRRMCGNGDAHTRCINFGLALQLFESSVTAEDAMILLDKRRPGGPVDVPLKETPQDNLDWVQPRKVLQSLQCTLFYTHSRARGTGLYEHYYVADPSVLPHPSWTAGGCRANATVTINEASWQMTADINFSGKTLSWTEDLHSLVAYPS